MQGPPWVWLQTPLLERNRRMKQRQQQFITSKTNSPAVGSYLYLNSKAPQCSLLSALRHRLLNLVNLVTANACSVH